MLAEFTKKLTRRYDFRVTGCSCEPDSLKRHGEEGREDSEKGKRANVHPFLHECLAGQGIISRMSSLKVKGLQVRWEMRGPTMD